MIDRILFNGHIITLDENLPRAQALAISGERLIAVGTNEDILPLAGPLTQRDDLRGRYLIPGLVDAHIHWEWLSRSLQAVDLFEVPSKAEAIERVASRAGITQSGEWITGRGWTQDLWDGIFPTARDIDLVSPHNPCYFSAKSGHAAWVNSSALRFAGIDATTPDPDGGQIVRGADGQPTGLLLETAMNLVSRHIPSPSIHELARYMLEAQKLALASGITAIHDFDNPSCLSALQLMREQGVLALRVVKQINEDWLEHAIASGIRSHFGDDWIRIGGLKLFADGALGPRTAYMLEPYTGEPHNTGIAVLPYERMQHLASRASAHGLSTSIHAIGDRAVRDVLNVFARVRAEEASRGELPHQRRHRIEHVQVIHPADAGRLADMQVIASMQPIHATSDWEVAMRYWGEERCEYAYNARLQIDRGAPVAFGSDSPVEPFEPLRGIHAAVTRQRADGSPSGGFYPELRLTMDEALHGFTTGPAYAAGMEDRQGRLKAGYLADCVVLDRDLYAIEPAEIMNMQVVATMVGGRWRWGVLD